MVKKIVRRWLLLVCVVATALCTGLTVANAAPEPPFPPSFPSDQNQLPQLPREPELYKLLPIPVPDDDPWYDDPPNLRGYAPGQIVRSRVVQTRFVGLPVPVFSKQLLFRSNDVHGRPIVTATTVLIPGIPWNGSPRPVLSYQEAIDSTDSSCNPSYTLRTGTMKELAQTQYWLEQGFAVNVPDFDGKYNTFNTFDEGQMVLDSLRALKNDRSLGLSRSGIVLNGYSGGGSGSIRAAELRKTYAPDVRLLGTAIGGTPGDLVAMARYAMTRQPGLTGFSSFTIWLGFAAVAQQYPDVIDPKKLLTPAGQQIIADMKHRCVYSAALTGAWRPIDEYFQPGKSLDTEPAVRKVLEDNSLGKHIPDTPVFWYHGFWDELIPPSRVVLPTVEKYWKAGADLRFYTVPTGEHAVNDLAGWLPAVAWTSAVLRGLPPGPRFKAEITPLPPGFPGS